MDVKKVGTAYDIIPDSSMERKQRIVIEGGEDHQDANVRFSDWLADVKEKWGAGWSGKFIGCKRCKGVGVVPDEFDEMDKLVSAFGQFHDSELEKRIEDAMDKYKIKNSKRPIFRKVLKHFVNEAKKYSPSAYEYINS